MRIPVLAALFPLAVRVIADDAPDFTRDVRPILSQHCFKCHGPDDKARKARLRLDVREVAVKEAKSGGIAIVPGKPADSELVSRIFSTDEDELMPPPSAKRPLTAEQKDVLRRWIAAGAEYQQHWAFVRPKQAELPSVKDIQWVRNPVDRFILSRLEAAGLGPSSEAGPGALCRRLYLDLVGLPPRPEEVDAFVREAGRDPQSAVESLVDRLLASPNYGERWARKWLDLARYADTNGYEKDRPRTIWPYRDWVINALNADKPFDQFTVEQIAGDMLPGATLDQRIATGFHRNTMLNEEGGIDPLEYRFHAMTDRVATTGVTWLGLTLGCAQCHTHKFDPITHREYYQVMAFLNNADEPELDLPMPDAGERRKENARRAVDLLAELPGRFPVDPLNWRVLRPAEVITLSGQKAEVLKDGSARFPQDGPEKDSYTMVLETDLPKVETLRIEVIADPAFPNNGPGRAPDGSFILSDVSITAAARSEPKREWRVKIASAAASAEQPGFPIAAVLDGKPETGWAVDPAKGKGTLTRTATFAFDKPVAAKGGIRLAVKLDQLSGGHRTLGRVRLSVGAPLKESGEIAARRRQLLDEKFDEWLQRMRGSLVAWQPLRPVVAKSNSPLLTVQPDASVFVSGDFTKADTYEVRFRDIPANVTAVRLEALPDERLPAHGPGIAYYEGPKGDFFLGEFQLAADGKPLKFSGARESYSGNFFSGKPASAALAIDGDPQTGWSTAERPGERHVAVFNFAQPAPAAGEWTVNLVMGRYYACSLGRFRISVTTERTDVTPESLPEDVEDLLKLPDSKLTAMQRSRLREEFLLSLPEFAKDAAKIRDLRKPTDPPTTLAFQERPPENPRPTFIHNRGEFLQPTDRVDAGVPAFLGVLPEGAPRNRLAFARWLVSSENPLTARVTVNRQWAAFFGRGIVKTTEDFGYQGEAPSHPELLDWLAVEFVKQGWSLKKLHRLIVTSATYRQSSRVAPALAAADPDNRLLGHFPRVRLDAEIIRDSALVAAGLLANKIGGPSVRPPQPEGVTEVVYGGEKWKASTGPDRYRRSLYTFAKRTAPFALYNTFDGPAGEACIARRDVSNTALQALTLLNDVVFVEAAQTLGRQLAARTGTTGERVREAFRRIVCREPAADELDPLIRFFELQRSRIASGELTAGKLAGDTAGDAATRAAWTALARALFSLDEVVTKG